jgi:hypothetical protein
MASGDSSCRNPLLQKVGYVIGVVVQSRRSISSAASRISFASSDGTDCGRRHPDHRRATSLGPQCVIATSTATTRVPADHPTIDHRKRLWDRGEKLRGEV